MGLFGKSKKKSSKLEDSHKELTEAINPKESPAIKIPVPQPDNKQNVSEVNPFNNQSETSTPTDFNSFDEQQTPKTNIEQPPSELKIPDIPKIPEINPIKNNETNPFDNQPQKLETNTEEKLPEINPKTEEQASSEVNPSKESNPFNEQQTTNIEEKLPEIKQKIKQVESEAQKIETKIENPKKVKVPEETPSTPGIFKSETKEKNKLPETDEDKQEFLDEIADKDIDLGSEEIKNAEEKLKVLKEEEKDLLSPDDIIVNKKLKLPSFEGGIPTLDDIKDISGDLFIKSNLYRKVLEDSIYLKKEIKEFDSIATKINTTINSQNKISDDTKSQLDKIQNNLMKIEKTLFSKKRYKNE